MSPRSVSPRPTLRCAIYTRKSSDEGLEQSFNSLHAQREACEAYIKSQTLEGWQCLPRLYDDGGFSGGSMDRPALRGLLADIASGGIDVVVVYKVDRLTRSLADFAKIVEAFDAKGVSFVSVTQAFNTTTSMGRLTLNVLLSFAQFEREVTGERIRDKIAASKAKGMWMGGNLPLGYDAGDHTLVVNAAEAETVRDIFARYLKSGSVHRLVEELERSGVRSKSRITRSGRTIGGHPFSRGALYHLLQNRHYLGQICHGKLIHPGQHPPIVDAKLFEGVQRKLAKNRIRKRERPTQAQEARLLGKLFDEAGRPYSPTFSYGRGGRRYGYYVLADVQQGRREDGDGPPPRLPAAALETFALASLRRYLGKPGAAWEDLLPAFVRLEVRPREARFSLEVGSVLGDHPELGMQDLWGRLDGGERAELGLGPPANLVVATGRRLQFRGGRIFGAGGSAPARRDLTLIKAVQDGHRVLAQVGLTPGAVTMDAKAPTDAYARKLMLLGLIDPAMQEAILQGRQPPQMSLARLLDTPLPLAWADQRKAHGATAAHPIGMLARRVGIADEW